MILMAMVAALGATVIVSIAALGALRWQVRGFDRERISWTEERRELLDRTMFALGRTWNEPPAQRERDLETEERARERRRMFEGITLHPENGGYPSPISAEELDHELGEPLEVDLAKLPLT